MVYNKHDRADQTSNHVETVDIEDDEPSSSSSQKSLLLAGPQKGYDTVEIYHDDDDGGEPSRSNENIVAYQYDLSKRLGNLNLTVLTICLCIGAAFPSMDTSIIFTTMTKIGSEFQSAQLSTWLHSSYTLCTLITMPAAGGMSNAFGRKPVLITLNMLFLVGSFWCGYATSFEQVVIARAISGLGGGGIALIGNIILHDIVPRDHLGSYLGYYNTAGMLGFGLGGPIGGFITDYFGWRYCFKINIIPMTVIIAIYIFYFQNYIVPQKDQKADLATNEKLRIVDFGGILFLSIANISLTCALLLGGNAYNWSSPQIIVILLLMLVGYILFFIHERRWAAYPLISRAASRDRNFTTSCFCSFSAAACEGAAVTVIPQFLMGVLHFNTSKAGLWLMANAAATPVGTFLAGRYMQWSGRFKRFLLADMASYLLMIIIFYNWVSGIVPISVGTMGIILEGVCYGGIQVCIIVACTSTLPKELAATALSIYTLARFMGYLVGTAVVSSIVQFTLKTILPTRIDGKNAVQIIEFIITSIQKVNTLAPEIQQIVAEVLDLGVQRVALYMITLGSLLFLIAALRYQNVSFKKENHATITDDETDNSDQRD